MFSESIAQTYSYIKTGKITFELHRVYGRYRVYVPDTPASVLKRPWDRSTILVGTASNQVYDYKVDMNPFANDTPSVVLNPTKSDYEIAGSYGNSRSNLPPNVKIKMNIYGWANQKWLLFKYTVKNLETTSKNAIVGFETIYNPSGTQSGFDTVEYVSSKKIVLNYLYDMKDSINCGMKILNADPYALHSVVYYANYWLGDTMLYRMISTNTIENKFVNPGTLPEPTTTFLSKSPVTLNPGDSTTVWLVYAVGDRKDSIYKYIAAAETKYQMLTSVEDNEKLFPTSFTLNQNYPNPFNPTTYIKYGLSKNQHVTLKIFNMLGKEVTTLVDEVKPAGYHQVQFHAANLPSGIYFYKITAGSFVETKKMILIK
jgi:hypothetical protein